MSSAERLILSVYILCPALLPMIPLTLLILSLLLPSILIAKRLPSPFSPAASKRDGLIKVLSVAHCVIATVIGLASLILQSLGGSLGITYGEWTLHMVKRQAQRPLT